MIKKNSMSRGNDSCRKVDCWNRHRSNIKSIALIVLIVIMGLLVSGFLDFVRGPETEWIQKTYVVSEGDTLWDIAWKVKQNGDSREAQEIVYELRQQNDLDKFIRPGDEVKIWVEALKDGQK